MSEAPVRRFWTVGETAVYLHFHPQHVYELLAKGRLPGARIGGSWRIDSKALEADLERDIAARTQKDGGR